jgi:hypothetical protein
MNFLIFWPYALIISIFFHRPLSELIKDKPALKVRLHQIANNNKSTEQMNLIQKIYNTLKMSQHVLL